MAQSQVDVLVMARERRRLDVAAVQETLLAKLTELRERYKDIKHKHAIVFYKTVGEAKEGSQQVRVSCLACSHEFESTGPTRLVKHLLRCPLMPADIKKPFQELNDLNESSKVQKRQHTTLVKEEAQQLAAEHAAKQAKLVQQSGRVGLKSLEVAEADLAIAKFFYANGLAFSAASASGAPGVLLPRDDKEDPGRASWLCTSRPEKARWPAAGRAPRLDVEENRRTRSRWVSGNAIR